MFSAIAILLANIPLWILGTSVDLNRPVFNVDFLVAILVGSWRAKVGVILLVLLWLVDLLQSVSLIFHFPNTAEFARSIEYISGIHVFDLLDRSIVGITLLFVAFAFLVSRLLSRKIFRAPSVVFWSFIIVVVDAVNGSSGFVNRRDIHLLNRNFAGSPSVNIAAIGFQERFRAPVESARVNIWPSHQTIVGWANAHPNASILVVVVESLGLPSNLGIRSWLREQLYTPDIAYGWDLYESTVAFSGATTSAEIRTLCESNRSYREVSRRSDWQCLPSRLRSLGWSTHAIHGFNANMFNRNEWWSAIGFDHKIFIEDISSAAPRCGGAFRGICDSYLVDEAINNLRNDRTFVYFLTLNTHLPLETVHLGEDFLQRCGVWGLTSSVCQLLGQHGLLFRRLSGSLALLPHRPLVLIVGDHAPPFARSADRVVFSKDFVPSYYLVPVSGRQ